MQRGAWTTDLTSMIKQTICNIGMLMDYNRELVGLVVQLAYIWDLISQSVGCTLSFFCQNKGKRKKKKKKERRLNKRIKSETSKNCVNN